MCKLLSKRFCSAVVRPRRVYKNAVSMLTFTGNAFLASRCVENLKPVLQAEAPDKLNRIFSQDNGLCFSLLSVQSPGGGGGLLGNASCYSHMELSNTKLLGHHSHTVKGCSLCDRSQWLKQSSWRV